MPQPLIESCWLVPLLPLLGALIVAVAGRWLGRHSHLPVVLGIGGAFVLSLLMLLRHEHAATVPIYEWLNLSEMKVSVLFRIDGLTLMMLNMVTFVATLVAIFAAGYMNGDPGYPRFFALVGLFVFCMTGLVLSSNFALTYAFWEGVGVCSYMLIGFWHAKPSAADAAKKAFLVNRIGDVGFALAIFWMWSLFGTLDYDAILDPSKLSALSEGAKWGIPALLFWAATAKSAQVPLYVWLPDAMEGPTPVSALIHAATMVTAGVYLVARSSLLMVGAPEVQMVVCIIGCATALLSALIGLTQTDLKRVLAYSTVSQLGYMFMGLGAGIGNVGRFAIIAGMFHLFTHAFFKALLFLGSGSVMHSMGHVIDMRRFGGLRHRMPVTCWTFAVGGLALSGIWPLAGFFSKDEILIAVGEAAEAAHEVGLPGWVYQLIFVSAVFTAFLTAFYTGRAFFLTFFGPEKLPSPSDPEAEPEEHAHGHDDHGHGHDHAHHPIGHESPPVMTVPLIVLAACTVLVGMAFGPWSGGFEHLLSETPGLASLPEPHGEHGWLVPIVGTAVGLAGLVLSYFLYGLRSPLPARLALQARPLYLASYHKFRVDEIYKAAIVIPTTVLANVAAFLDLYLVDGLVRGIALVPRALGTRLFAPFQNGLVQYYAAITALSVAVLFLILVMI
ncbi:MAG: NADH-quinone oxidoreductase subunit L [Isosphaeraceae bacterium]